MDKIKNTAVAVLTLLSCGWLITAHAETDEMPSGLWQITTKVEMPGMPSRDGGEDVRPCYDPLREAGRKAQVDGAKKSGRTWPAKM